MYIVQIFKCHTCFERCGFQIQDNQIKGYLNAYVEQNEIMFCGNCSVELARFKLMDSENKEKA